MRQDSKSDPNSTFEDFMFPWVRPGFWWMQSSPVAKSSAILRHEVQWRGFPPPLALVPEDSSNCYGQIMYNINETR